MNLSFEEGIVLHSTRQKNIPKSEYQSELSRCRTKCGQCKLIVQRVRSLFQEVTDLMRHDFVGVCEHCKRANTAKYCKRCEYVVSKFVNEHKSRVEERQKRFKAWLLKVRTLLQEIQNTVQECGYIFYKDTDLERILKQLEAPLSTRIPNIDYFPNVEDHTLSQIMSKSKEILSDILTRIHIESENKRFTSGNSLFPTPSMHKGACMCKLLKANQELEKELLPSTKTEANEDIKIDNLLLQMLIDLEERISKETYENIDKRLLNRLVASIADAKRHGLLYNIIKNLLISLVDLKKSLNSVQITSVTKDYVDNLIVDLENSLDKILSQQILHVLTDLSYYLAQQINDRANMESENNAKYEEHPSMEQISEVVSTLLALNEVLKQGLLSDGKSMQGITNKLKSLVNMNICNVNKVTIQKLSELCEILALGIPKIVNMDKIQVLIIDINNIIQQIVSTEQDRQLLLKNLIELYKNIIGTPSKETNKAFSALSTNKLWVDKGINDKKGGHILNDRGIEEMKTKKQIKISNKKELNLVKVGKENEASVKKEQKYIKDVIKASQDATGKINNVKSRTENKVTRRKEQKDKKETKLRKNSEENYDLKNYCKLLKTHKMNATKSEKSKSPEAYEITKLKAVEEIEDTKLKALALLSDLPQIKVHTPTSSTASFENYIKCDVESDSLKYFVQGTSLKPYHKYVEKSTLPPLILNVMEAKAKPCYGTLNKEAESLPKKKNKETEGLFKYQLSNKEYIVKGWTILPTEKVMRRMNIYKMEPATSTNYWLQRLRNEKMLYYDTGEVFAQIDEFGCDKWYYKNGNLALEYYKAQEMFAGQRFIVHSSGDEYLNGFKVRTILAIFDYLGNGVIYDLDGNIRLKYNQSEGIINDPKIGPPGQWKWHTLNDPPVIEKVFFDLIETHKYESLKKDASESDNDAFVTPKSLSHDEMLQIELDNFAKAKMKKLSQKFRPFEIKMKAAKLNNNFSVRILNQSNISLVYREGSTNFKINLGMNLNSTEIIDSQIYKIGDVATPYDDYPARSQSVANIQQTLTNIRKLNKKLNQRRN